MNIGQRKGENMNISDDILYFDTAWYTEQILNSPTKEKIKMEDKGVPKAEIGKSDKADATIEDTEVSPCQCCGETDCSLSTNEWTDD
jgi:hypothetical protein